MSKVVPKEASVLKPLSDFVLVLPDEPPDKVGNIILPDSAKAKPTRGRVVSVGPGRWNTDGAARVAMQVKAGDSVIYSKYEGSDVELEGVTYKVLREDSILCVVLES